MSTYGERWGDLMNHWDELVAQYVERTIADWDVAAERDAEEEDAED